MTLWVYSGRPSDSANLLSQEPGFKRLKTGKFVKPGDFIINWGNTAGHPVLAKHHDFRILNLPDKIGKAVNKKVTFQLLMGAGIQTVPWTANKAIAQGWLDQGRTVICRKTLTGHEGSGIIIVEPGKELVEAPLYTLYIFKLKEFRVHVTQYGVIDTQQKVKDPKRDVIDWKVRSYKNGFIFQRKNIEPNVMRDNLAVSTMKALGLDFGGLDIIEDKQGNFYVLEVNTAPGIEGQTVQLYADTFRNLTTGLIYGKPGPGLQVAPKPVKFAVGPGIRNLNLGWAA